MLKVKCSIVIEDELESMKVYENNKLLSFKFIVTRIRHSYFR